MNYFFTIEQLPVDTVEIEMNGNTFYYSKNRKGAVFMSDFYINNIHEVEEKRKMYEQSEKVKNEDWHDKYNELWDKYIFYKDECRALKEQINKIQESQTENELNSK